MEKETKINAEPGGSSRQLNNFAFAYILPVIDTATYPKSFDSIEMKKTILIYILIILSLPIVWVLVTYIENSSRHRYDDGDLGYYHGSLNGSANLDDELFLSILKAEPKPITYRLPSLDLSKYAILKLEKPVGQIILKQKKNTITLDLKVKTANEVRYVLAPTEPGPLVEIFSMQQPQDPIIKGNMEYG